MRGGANWRHLERQVPAPQPDVPIRLSLLKLGTFATLARERKALQEREAKPEDLVGFA